MNEDVNRTVRPMKNAIRKNANLFDRVKSFANQTWNKNEDLCEIDESKVLLESNLPDSDGETKSETSSAPMFVDSTSLLGFPEENGDMETDSVSESTCAFCNCGQEMAQVLGDLSRYNASFGFDIFDLVPEYEIQRETVGMNSKENGFPAELLPARPSKKKRGRPPTGKTQHLTSDMVSFGSAEMRNIHDVFGSEGSVLAHHCCAAWSAGVCQTDSYDLENVDKAVFKALSVRCSHCGRYGASIECQIQNCEQIYHYPCCASAGTFQDIKSMILLCPDHLDHAEQLAGSEACCVICDNVGDVVTQLFCTSCGRHYHGTCLEPSVTINANVRMGWQCPECKVCQGCRQPGDDDKMLFCDVCDKGFHLYCLTPKMATIPKTGWKCTQCRQCDDCGSRVPGGGPTCRWHRNYTLCDRCYQQRKKGQSCLICSRAVRQFDSEDWINQCMKCSKWVHSDCDDGPVEDSTQYVCPPCRSVGPLANLQDSVINSYGQHHGFDDSFPDLESMLAHHGQRTLTLEEADAISRTAAGYMQHTSPLLIESKDIDDLDINFEEVMRESDASNSLPFPNFGNEDGILCGIDDFKDDLTNFDSIAFHKNSLLPPRSLLSPTSCSNEAAASPTTSRSNLSNGKGKKRIPLFKVKPNKSPGQANKKKLKPPKGAVGRAKVKYPAVESSANKENIQLLSDVPANEKVKDQDDSVEGLHSTVVLVSTKDSYTLGQDMCMCCGSFGKDEEGNLIACVQCGQCFHPYCVNIKVNKVIMTKGWRCLDCTVCEGCGENTDEGKLLLCDNCDVSYHIYCLDPPLDDVPQEGWRCKWCIGCDDCGSINPGFHSKWMSNYTQCGPCASNTTCPICCTDYNDNELIVKCSNCGRWLHGECDGLVSEEDADLAGSYGYHCCLCRPSTNQWGIFSSSTTVINFSKMHTSTGTMSRTTTAVVTTTTSVHVSLSSMPINGGAASGNTNSHSKRTRTLHNLKARRRTTMTNEIEEGLHSGKEMALQPLSNNRPTLKAIQNGNVPGLGTVEVRLPALKAKVKKEDAEMPSAMLLTDVGLKQIKSLVVRPAVNRTKSRDKDNTKAADATESLPQSNVSEPHQPNVATSHISEDSKDIGPMLPTDNAVADTDLEDVKPTIMPNDAGFVFPPKKLAVVAKPKPARVVRKPKGPDETSNPFEFFGATLLKGVKRKRKQGLLSCEVDMSQSSDDEFTKGVNARGTNPSALTTTTKGQAGFSLNLTAEDLPASQQAKALSTAGLMKDVIKGNEEQLQVSNTDNLSQKTGALHKSKKQGVTGFSRSSSVDQVNQKRKQRKDKPPYNSSTSHGNYDRSPSGLTPTGDLGFMGISDLPHVDGQEVEEIFAGLAREMSVDGNSQSQSPLEQASSEFPMDQPKSSSAQHGRRDSYQAPAYSVANTDMSNSYAENGPPSYQDVTTSYQQLDSFTSSHAEYSGSFTSDKAFTSQSSVLSEGGLPSGETDPFKAVFGEDAEVKPKQRGDVPSPRIDGQKQLRKWHHDEGLGQYATISPVLYANLMHPNLKVEYPEWPSRARAVARLWRKLPPEQREPFRLRARNNRVRQKDQGRKGRPSKDSSNQGSTAHVERQQYSSIGTTVIQESSDPLMGPSGTSTPCPPDDYAEGSSQLPFTTIPLPPADRQSQMSSDCLFAQDSKDHLSPSQSRRSSVSANELLTRSADATGYIGQSELIEQRQSSLCNPLVTSVTDNSLRSDVESPNFHLLELSADGQTGSGREEQSSIISEQNILLEERGQPVVHSELSLMTSVEEQRSSCDVDPSASMSSRDMSIFTVVTDETVTSCKSDGHALNAYTSDADALTTMATDSQAYNDLPLGSSSSHLDASNANQLYLTTSDMTSSIAQEEQANVMFQQQSGDSVNVSQFSASDSSAFLAALTNTISISSAASSSDVAESHGAPQLPVMTADETIQVVNSSLSGGLEHSMTGFADVPSSKSDMFGSDQQSVSVKLSQLTSESSSRRSSDAGDVKPEVSKLKISDLTLPVSLMPSQVTSTCQTFLGGTMAKMSSVEQQAFLYQQQRQFMAAQQHYIQWQLQQQQQQQQNNEQLYQMNSVSFNVNDKDLPEVDSEEQHQERIRFLYRQRQLQKQQVHQLQQQLKLQQQQMSAQKPPSSSGQNGSASFSHPVDVRYQQQIMQQWMQQQRMPEAFQRQFLLEYTKSLQQAEAGKGSSLLDNLVGGNNGGQAATSTANSLGSTQEQGVSSEEGKEHHGSTTESPVDDASKARPIETPTSVSESSQLVSAVVSNPSDAEMEFTVSQKPTQEPADDKSEQERPSNACVNVDEVNLMENSVLSNVADPEKEAISGCDSNVPTLADKVDGNEGCDPSETSQSVINEVSLAVEVTQSSSNVVGSTIDAPSFDNVDVDNTASGNADRHVAVVDTGSHVSHAEYQTDSVDPQFGGQLVEPNSTGAITTTLDAGKVDILQVKVEQDGSTGYAPGPCVMLAEKEDDSNANGLTTSQSYPHVLKKQADFEGSNEPIDVKDQQHMTDASDDIKPKPEPLVPSSSCQLNAGDLTTAVAAKTNTVKKQPETKSKSKSSKKSRKSQQHAQPQQQQQTLDFANQAMKIMPPQNPNALSHMAMMNGTVPAVLPSSTPMMPGAVPHMGMPKPVTLNPASVQYQQVFLHQHQLLIMQFQQYQFQLQAQFQQLSQQQMSPQQQFLLQQQYHQQILLLQQQFVQQQSQLQKMALAGIQFTEQQLSAMYHQQLLAQQAYQQWMTTLPPEQQMQLQARMQTNMHQVQQALAALFQSRPKEEVPEKKKPSRSRKSKKNKSGDGSSAPSTPLPSAAVSGSQPQQASPAVPPSPLMTPTPPGGLPSGDYSSSPTSYNHMAANRMPQHIDKQRQAMTQMVVKPTDARLQDQPYPDVTDEMEMARSRPEGLIQQQANQPLPAVYQEQLAPGSYRPVRYPGPDPMAASTHPSVPYRGQYQQQQQPGVHPYPSQMPPHGHQRFEMGHPVRLDWAAQQQRQQQMVASSGMPYQGASSTLPDAPGEHQQRALSDPAAVQARQQYNPANRMQQHQQSVPLQPVQQNTFQGPSGEPMPNDSHDYGDVYGMMNKPVHGNPAAEGQGYHSNHQSSSPIVTPGRGHPGRAFPHPQAPLDYEMQSSVMTSSGMYPLPSHPRQPGIRRVSQDSLHPPMGYPRPPVPPAMTKHDPAITSSSNEHPVLMQHGNGNDRNGGQTGGQSVEMTSCQQPLPSYMHEATTAEHHGSYGLPHQEHGALFSPSASADPLSHNFTASFGSDVHDHSATAAPLHSQGQQVSDVNAQQSKHSLEPSKSLMMSDTLQRSASLLDESTIDGEKPAPQYLAARDQSATEKQSYLTDGAYSVSNTKIEQVDPNALTHGGEKQTPFAVESFSVGVPDVSSRPIGNHGKQKQQGTSRKKKSDDGSLKRNRNKQRRPRVRKADADKALSDRKHLRKIRSGSEQKLPSAATLNGSAVPAFETLMGKFPLCEPEVRLVYPLVHPYGSGYNNETVVLLGTFGNASEDGVTDYYSQFPSPDPPVTSSNPPTPPASLPPSPHHRHSPVVDGMPNELFEDVASVKSYRPYDHPEAANRSHGDSHVARQKNTQSTDTVSVTLTLSERSGEHPEEAVARVTDMLGISDGGRLMTNEGHSTSNDGHGRQSDASQVINGHNEPDRSICCKHCGVPVKDHAYVRSFEPTSQIVDLSSYVVLNEGNFRRCRVGDDWQSDHEAFCSVRCVRQSVAFSDSDQFNDGLRPGEHDPVNGIAMIDALTSVIAVSTGETSESMSITSSGVNGSLRDELPAVGMTPAQTAHIKRKNLELPSDSFTPKRPRSPVWIRWKLALVAKKKKRKSLSDTEVTELLKQHGVAMKLDCSVIDERSCMLCGERGDGMTEGEARLLNFDVDVWVHLNCALWSLEVYESLNGALHNVQEACTRGNNTLCNHCHSKGATIGCVRMVGPSRIRCEKNFHFGCAIKAGCMFFQDKTVLCPQHKSLGAKEQRLPSYAVFRRVYIDRNITKQLASVLRLNIEEEHTAYTMRIGSLIFTDIGQLLPHQLHSFHSKTAIYPVGFKTTRIFWSRHKLSHRCRYECVVRDKDNTPCFDVTAREIEGDLLFSGNNTKDVWSNILLPVRDLRKNANVLKVFPEFLSGDDLFGLTDASFQRIAESLPGVDTIIDYQFRFGRSPILIAELPLAINPTGCVRSEKIRKPHLNRPLPKRSTTGSSATPSGLSSTDDSGFSYAQIRTLSMTKAAQYRRLKQEWRTNVLLKRSRIQGLGLFANRDIEVATMVIEYIGHTIRNEVANRREGVYERANRGVYMFRIDADMVVDATMTGGPARYINHSCDPNCAAEIVTIDKEQKIIIISSRRIEQGEELTYDYKFDIEDEQHKIPCLCGAVNCRKWMN